MESLSILYYLIDQARYIASTLRDYALIRYSRTCSYMFCSVRTKSYFYRGRPAYCVYGEGPMIVHSRIYQYNFYFLSFIQLFQPMLFFVLFIASMVTKFFGVILYNLLLKHCKIIVCKLIPVTWNVHRKRETNVIFHVAL